MGLTRDFSLRHESLAPLVQAMLDRAGTSIVLAVGDLMLDRFISGKVHRISPEAPIPVLAVDRDTSMPGGVGNVVANIRALGGRAELVAVVGDDTAAGTLASLLGAGSGIGLVTDGSRPTAVKERFIAGGQQLLRADYEQARPVAAEIEDLLIA